VDVYVEGREDKYLLDWHFRRTGFRERFVYSIDSVEVPDGLLVEHGLDPHSARNRIIVLASHLQNAGITPEQSRLIVDRDQEDLVKTRGLSDDLIVTGHGALSIALTANKSLQTIGELFCHDHIAGDVFADDVYAAAARLYLIRAAAKRLGFPLKIGAVTDFVSVAKNRIRFDETAYIRRMAEASGLVGSLGELAAEIVRCEAIASGLALPAEVMANDHDLLAVSLRVIRLCGGLVNRSEDDLRLMMMARLDSDLLDEYDVIKRLK
jgi:hypothetical protein